MANQNEIAEDEFVLTVRGSEVNVRPISEMRNGWTTSYCEIKLGDCRTRDVIEQLLEYYEEERLIEIIKSYND